LKILSFLTYPLFRPIYPCSRAHPQKHRVFRPISIRAPARIENAENPCNSADVHVRTDKNAKNTHYRNKEKTESEEIRHSASPNGLDTTDSEKAPPVLNGDARTPEKRSGKPISKVEQRVIATWREHPDWSLKTIGSECAVTARRAEQIIEKIKAGAYDG